MLEGLRGKPDAGADLILAADAMVYVRGHRAADARGRSACWRRRALGIHGRNPCAARASCSATGLRYAHSAAYVRASIGDAGLDLSRLEDLSARNEDNAPVPGLVVVAAKG